MAPAFAAFARSLLTHALSARDANTDNTAAALGPLVEARSHILARDSDRPDPESGIVHPGDINNKAVFALFGLIGVALIITGIWFFFWARNGGFYFKENDWDDYKSTVLRRKGPNGTTLSGATTETDLGGGSVYKDVDDGNTQDNSTVITGTTGLTGITGGVSDFAGRERRRKKREQKEREKERRREERRREKDEKKKSRSSRKVAEDGGIIDEDAEAEAAQYLRNYRHERPARVGGINKESDSSTWDGSTNPTESSRSGYTGSTVTSELMSNQERETPVKKSGGIRKVYSTADKRDSRETERIRAEARKLQEKGRAAAAASSAGSSSGHRRNFSWQRDNRIDESTAMIGAPPPSYTASEIESRIPGSWTESDVGSELGTKSYHHVIPGLSTADGEGSSVAGGTDVRDYAEERRKKRGGAGYRRDRNR